MTYKTADEAFRSLYKMINDNGIIRSTNKCLTNIGFTILNPLENEINTSWRGWKKDYADFEWDWYLSADPDATEIAKKASIWYRCMDRHGKVNSNYGWQWSKSGQLDYVIDQLRKDKETRRASISIYNGNDRYNFENDTPCTYAINFQIIDEKLNMTVLMRSNDLWFGFCNDQYCFSRLQEMVSKELSIEVGSYYHFADNIHLYNKFLNRNV